MNLYFCTYADPVHGGAIQEIPAPDSRSAAVNFLACQGWLDSRRRAQRVAVHVQNTQDTQDTRCTMYRVRRTDLGSASDTFFSCVYLGPVDRALAPPISPDKAG